MSMVRTLSMEPHVHADTRSMTGSDVIWTALFFRYKYFTLQDEVKQR